MANNDYAKRLSWLLGQGAPAPYMQPTFVDNLQGYYNNARQGLGNLYNRVNGYFNPGMSPMLFNQLDENDPATYQLLKKVYNY